MLRGEGNWKTLLRLRILRNILRLDVEDLGKNIQLKLLIILVLILKKKRFLDLLVNQVVEKPLVEKLF